MRAWCSTVLTLLACMWAGASAAAAQSAPLPRSLVAEALSEFKPSVFSPADFGVEDYALRRPDADAGAPEAASAALVRGSFEWVRVAKLVVVPRAVLQVRAPGAEAGQVHYAGFVHPLVVHAGLAQVDVPVVLLASSEQSIEIETRRAGVTRVERVAVVFAPRPQHRGRVMLDSSCSPYALRVLHGAIPPDSWLYVGCRQIRTAYADHVAATLELLATWDGVAPGVEVDGIATQPVTDALYALRVGPQPGFVQLRAGAALLVLGYGAASHLSSAFLGAGIGPYLYRHQERAGTVEMLLPVVTLYAGYTFSATTRIVYFNAFIPDVHGSIDQGLYLWLEQARFVDERMSFNLLLGGNLLVYRHDGTTTTRFSLPQGFEVVIRDLFTANFNLTGGAFLYPALQGRAYYNTWVRLGSPQLFGELNYIDWQETHGTAVTKSRVLGLSFGIPLLRFL